ncbi:hypothetical protein Q3G72_004612 [Acer saccharum]|nr:hypothetical protein Q3G72_004612 [Acer saccharum]
MVAGGRVGRNLGGSNCHNQHTQSLGLAIAANNFKAIWVYLTAPILEELCGAGTYSAVKLPEQDSTTHEKHSTAGSFRRKLDDELQDLLYEFLEERGIGSESRKEKWTSASSLQYPMVIPTIEPYMTVGKLGLVYRDEKFSRDLSKEVSDAKVQASHTPSATLTGSTKWPLMGGVPCQSNDTEDALVERLYVAGYQDGSVRIWDATSDFFSAIYFSQCNTLAVHVLPQGDGPQCMAVFSFLNSPICNLQFADFGGRLAVGFECGRVAMLDISTLSVLFLTDGISDSSSPVRSLAVKSFSDTNSIANSTKDSNINTSTDSTKSVVFFMTKDGHIVVCDSTTGFILASQPIHSKESSIISMYILGNEAKNESAQTNAVEKDIPLAAELETSTETTYFGQRLKDLFVLLCCEDSLLLFSLKSVIQVNGYEFAFISLLAYENDLRIPESLPCLHNKVVAAAAEATINLSLSQKEVEDTAPGILSGIIKGFKAGKVEHKVDLPEISNSTCARLGHIFSYPPFLKPYTDIEEDPLFLKPHTVAVKDYQEVVELNIGSLALTLILLLCPLSPFFSNCTIDLVQMTLSFSILGADKRLEKERLFEGAPKTRTVGARIRKRKRK